MKIPRRIGCLDIKQVLKSMFENTKIIKYKTGPEKIDFIKLVHISRIYNNFTTIIFKRCLL